MLIRADMSSNVSALEMNLPERKYGSHPVIMTGGEEIYPGRD